MQEFELYHHGIKGQKWGKRNGPPYPLSKKVAKAVKSGAKATVSGVKATYHAGKKVYETVEGASEEIRHQKMMRIIKRGKFKELLKHVDDFNDEELEMAKKRLKLQKEIRDIKYADKETGRSIVDKGVDMLKTGATIFTSVNSIVTSKESIAKIKSGKEASALKAELDVLSTKANLEEARRKAANAGVDRTIEALKRKTSLYEAQTKYKEAMDKASGKSSGIKIDDATKKLLQKTFDTLKTQSGDLSDIIQSGYYSQSDLNALKNIVENMDKIKKLVG